MTTTADVLKLLDEGLSGDFDVEDLTFEGNGVTAWYSDGSIFDIMVTKR